MNRRILSIQSHVAFGYVGGKAAVFPLQCLGFDVDVINTVNFSNHSGYGRFGGSRANAEELSNLFRLMEENGVLSPSRLLTGYVPGAEALSSVAELVKKLRANKHELIYLLDPVMGDAGKLYVAENVVPIYRSMLPFATIITPNWFEVEVLTKVKVTNMQSLRLALRILHEEYHVPHVVISSMPVKPFLREALPAALRPPSGSTEEECRNDFLLCLSSSHVPETCRPSPSEISTVNARCIPCIPGYFSGVGDLFSALVLAHFDPSLQSHCSKHGAVKPAQTPLSFAAYQALIKTYAILKLTHDLAQELPEEDRTATDEEKDSVEPERKIRRMKGRELRIIQGQNIIRDSYTGEMSTWENFWLPPTI